MTVLKCRAALRSSVCFANHTLTTYLAVEPAGTFVDPVAGRKRAQYALCSNTYNVSERTPGWRNLALMWQHGAGQLGW